MTRTDCMRNVRPRRLWTPELRQCLQCGGMFMAHLRDLVYCSPKCGRKARGCDAHGRPLKRAS